MNKTIVVSNLDYKHTMYFSNFSDDTSPAAVSASRKAVLSHIQKLEKVRIRFEPNHVLETFLSNTDCMGFLSTVRLKVTVDDPDGGIGTDRKCADTVAIGNSDTKDTVANGNRKCNDVDSNNIKTDYSFLKSDFRKEISHSDTGCNSAKQLTASKEERHAPDGELSKQHKDENPADDIEIFRNSGIYSEHVDKDTVSGKADADHKKTQATTKDKTVDEIHKQEEETFLDLHLIDPLTFMRSMKMPNSFLDTSFGIETTNHEKACSYMSSNVNETNESNGIESQTAKFPLNISVHRSSVNIKSFQPTNFDKEGESESVPKERGRSKHKHRLPETNDKRAEFTGHSDEDTGELYDSNVEYLRFNDDVRRGMDKVALANEMWFGKYRTAFDAKDYRRARSASPNTYASRSKSGSRKGSERNGSTSGSRKSGKHNKGKAHESDGKSTKSGGETDCPERGDTKTSPKGFNNNQSGNGKPKVSSKDKRRRNVTIAGNIISDIKEARKRLDDEKECTSGKEPLDGDENDRNREVIDLKNISEPKEEQYRTDVTMECLKEVENVNGVRNESPAAGQDTGEDSKASELSPSDKTIHVMNDIQRKYRFLSTFDKRQRNKTIADDISESLKQAKELDQNNSIDNDTNIPQDTAGEDKHKDDLNKMIERRNRHKTISVDIREILKEARKSQEIGEEERVKDSESDSLGPERVQDKESESSARYFNGRRKLHYQDGNKGHGTTLTDSIKQEGDTSNMYRLTCNPRLTVSKLGTMGATGGYVNSISGKLNSVNSHRAKADRSKGQPDLANKFRIPSFEEMLYNN